MTKIFNNKNTKDSQKLEDVLWDGFYKENRKNIINSYVICVALFITTVVGFFIFGFTHLSPNSSLSYSEKIAAMQQSLVLFAIFGIAFVFALYGIEYFFEKKFLKIKAIPNGSK